MSAECWCREVHPENPADITEAWPTFWHAVVAAVRLPQFVGWLSEKLS